MNVAARGWWVDGLKESGRGISSCCNEIQWVSCYCQL